MLIRNCVICKTAFETKRSHAMYCSRPCARKIEKVTVKKRKLRNGGRVVGGTDNCTVCSEVYVIKGRKSNKCESCRKEKRLELYRNYNQSSIRKDRLKDRMMTDPKYAIDRRMGRSIRDSVRAGMKNGRTWESFVDYSLTDLIKHLSRQFVDGMSWDRMNEWHIDHIVPLASFNYTKPEDEEFRAAWALTNLRPLWAKENLKKSDQRLFLI